MKTSAVSTGAAVAAVVVVAIVVGVATYYVSYGMGAQTITSTVPGPTVTQTSSLSDYQTVYSLAFQHWTAIGDANLTGIMSQYAPSAQLWWYSDNSPLNTLKGPYTGSNISATWQKFLGVGKTYWTVFNFTIAFPSQGVAKVTADVWYILGTGSNARTLYLPYELDYSLINGKWMLVGDWWGLPNHYGVIYQGVVMPGSVTTSSSTSTTTKTSSTSSYPYYP